MKRYFFPILFLWTLSVPSGHLFGEPISFESNSLGMAIRKIEPFRIADYEYVLTVDRTEGGKETAKTLYEKGQEVKKWIDSFGNGFILEERYFEVGSLVSETFFSSPDKISRILFYGEEGGVTEVHEYVYGGDLLREIIVSDGKEELYRNIYFRSGDGRLRRVVRRYPEGAEKIASYTNSGEKIVQEWHGSENTGDLFLYDRERDLKQQDFWEKNELKSREEYTYEKDGTKRSTLINYDSGIREKKWYFKNGEVQRVLKSKEDVLLEDTRYRYEGDKVSEKTVWTPGVMEKWIYAYNGDTMETETYYKNGKLKTVTTFTGENSYYQDVYHDGTPFIRIFYEKDEKVKQEILLSR